MKQYTYEVARIYEPASSQLGRLYDEDDLTDKLKEYGEKGWRLAAALPAIQDATGRFAAFDLVFEKETVKRKEK